MTKFFLVCQELTGIRARKLGKTILNVEISPTDLLLEVAVFCTKVKIAQGLFRWKVDNASFP